MVKTCSAKVVLQRAAAAESAVNEIVRVPLDLDARAFAKVGLIKRAALPSIKVEPRIIIRPYELFTRKDFLFTRRQKSCLLKLRYPTAVSKISKAQ